MKKLLIICTVAVSLATGFAFPAMAEDQRVTGTWTGTAVRLNSSHSSWITHEFTLVLMQNGQAVRGTFSGRWGGAGDTEAGRPFEGGHVKGTFVGDKLLLKIGAARWVEATVIGNSMSGKTGSGINLPFDLTMTRAIGDVAAALKQVGDELSVGTNRTGEACHVRRVDIVVERFNLYCEGWNEPSGRVTRFASAKDFPPQRLVSDSTWYQSLSGRLGECQPVEQTTLADGTTAALRECIRAQGGWHVLIIAAVFGDMSYTLETLPTNLSVLELAVEVIRGKRPAAAPAGKTIVSAAIRRAETMVGATGALVGVQDVGAHATLIELGQLRDWAADFAASEAAFRRALEIEERLLGANRTQSGFTITWIGAEVGLQGRFAESDQWFARAEPLVKQSYVPWHYPQHLTKRCDVERLKGHHAEAIKYGEEAIRIYEGQRVVSEAGLAESLSHTVRAYWAAGRLDEVERGLSRVLTLLEKPGPNPSFRAWRVGETHHNLGVFYLNGNRLAEARKHLELGLKQRESFLGPSLRATYSLMELGRLGRAEGALPLGLQAYRRAADIASKDPLTRGTLRSDAFAGYFDTLLDLGSAALDQGDALAGELLVATQIPRDNETAKAISAMSVRLASADPAIQSATREYQEAVRRRDRARETYATQPFRPESERDPDQEEALKQGWRTAEDAVSLLEEGLQAKFPKYVGLTSARPLSATDVTRLLRPGEAVLCVVQTRQAAYVLLVRDGTVSVHRAPITREAMDGDVRRLRNGLDLTDGRLRAFDRALAFQLYQSLLAPLASRLQGVTHLITVTTGPIQSLPLALLVTQPPSATDRDDYRNTAWLAHQFAISVLPSLSSLKDLRALVNKPRAQQPFIGFGDPTFSGNGGTARNAAGNFCREGALLDMEMLRGLPPLPETAEELRQMARSLGAGVNSVVLGAEATEGRVRSTDLSQYRVIAFATHGLLPSDLRCKAEAALALTPPASPSTTDDGLLDASEIAQLRLDADFVVLSACNTAAPDGRLLGESLSGLARGFLYAGARGLLVSHWAVASRPTVALTTGLFTEYGKNRSLGRAEALRQAQQALWQEAATAHPALWAPFVLVGDGGPESRQP